MTLLAAQEQKTATNDVAMVTVRVLVGGGVEAPDDEAAMVIMCWMVVRDVETLTPGARFGIATTLGCEGEGFPDSAAQLGVEDWLTVGENWARNDGRALGYA